MSATATHLTIPKGMFLAIAVTLRQIILPVLKGTSAEVLMCVHIQYCFCHALITSLVYFPILTWLNTQISNQFIMHNYVCALYLVTLANYAQIWLCKFKPLVCLTSVMLCVGNSFANRDNTSAGCQVSV